MANEKLDEFHAHEALDRAAMLAGLFEGWVQQHPYVEADPELTAKADTVMRAMSDFHQAVGRKALA
jgi:hypothetical protein